MHRRHELNVWTAGCLAVLATALACSGGDGRQTSTASATGGDGGVVTATGGTATTAATGSGTAGSSTGETTHPPKFDLGGAPDAGGECGATNDAVLTGVVHAPNGEVPVSGALVYVTPNEPPGIPQEVYCAKCQSLPDCTPFTFTEPDGSFSLPVPSGAGQYLTVVKGQFMRTSPLDIAPGNTALPATVTDLPGVNDPANGLYIPKIALGMSSPDRFELILGKVGLGMVDGNDNLIPGTETFDAYDNSINPATSGYNSKGPFVDLVLDPAALAQYHILFVPCIGPSALAAVQQDPTPLREWVAAGGRIYATDYAQQWIETLFPDYQTFNGEPGTPTPIGYFDSQATVVDANLLAWLQALPDPLKDVNPINGGGNTWPTLLNLPSVTIIENFTGIELPLPDVWAPDGMGGQINVGHKAWLEGTWPGKGGLYPPAVMAQYGCGRLHFTSYHTVGTPHKGMIPQELVMLYSILEVGVCQEQVPEG